MPHAFHNIRRSTISHAAPDANQDATASSAIAIAVADGITAKNGAMIVEGRPVGRLIATAVAERAVGSLQTGRALADVLTDEARAVCERLGISSHSQPDTAPGCVVACAHIMVDKLVVTMVGDVGVRINGEMLIQSPATVDELTSTARAHYIALTGDIAGSRAFILPLLLAQSAYSNNSDHPLGFGVVTDTATPDKFVTVTEFDASSVETIELFTDGYPAIPDETSIEAWEAAYAAAVAADPHRCGEFKATKTKDDRTVLIADVT